MPLPVVDPSRYEAQLQDKVAGFMQAAEALAPPSPTVFRSSPSHYRLRAEFRIWHEGDQLDYVMFDPEAPGTPIRQLDFAAGSQLINEAMPRLRDYVRTRPVLRNKLFQAEFLSTLRGELLVTLLYHRQLDAAWRAAAEEMAGALGLLLIGRSRKQKIVLERDWVTEEFTVGSRRLRFRQYENSFTQPNGEINGSMLAWAVAAAGRRADDLLELYCGNGNFTLALAPCFGRVLATEISKTGIAAARWSATENGVANVELVRLSSEEISAALAGQRQFRRLAAVNLPAYRFGTLFVDPPRSGLDPATLALAAGFERILYISCNPATLIANLSQLGATHRIDELALFDQFPYTHHLECGVLLQRR